MGSETGWGAVALALKAYGKKRNLYHQSHRSLKAILYKSSEKKKDPEMPKLFQKSQYLHVNFYESYLEEKEVKEHLQAATKLTEKLHNYI